MLDACVWTVSPECYLDEDGVTPLVETNIALALKPGDGVVATRMSDDITQVNAGTNANKFRGIQKMYLIPFAVQGRVSASDLRHGRNLQLPQTGIPPTWNSTADGGAFAGLVTNNNAHLYNDVFMRSGTSGVLAYGKATDEAVSATPSDSVDFKRRNGVLRAHGLDSAASPAEMEFTLEPFIADENEVTGTVSGLLTYLNSIAAASVSYTGYTRHTTNTTTWSYYWNNPSSYSNHSILTNAFSTLTGSGLAFSGSSSALEAMLTSLYNGLNDIANNQNNSSDYRQEYYGRYSYNVSGYYYYVYQLARQIRTLINNSTYVTLSGSGNSVTVTLKSPWHGFPASLGIPEGSVALQWNGSEFVQAAASGSAMAPATAYCYPPSLWYWTNSSVKTSDNDAVVAEYISSNATWSSILANYTFGNTVIPGVASAALTSPLQYGVAQLRVRFNYAVSQGGTSQLLDSQLNAIPINNANFPFTGIIIGEQRNQGWNFRPKSGTNYYVYDSEVNDGTNPKAWIASSGSGLLFKDIHTLVVQSEDGEDVHYALEFRNDSETSFCGVNGCAVSPGSKFYLVGILSLADAVNNTSETLNSIFVQDHITQASFTITGLAKAYNTIPELRNPQLEIGVQTEMKWVGTTPASIPMY